MTGKGHTLAGLICMIGATKFSIDLTNSATCGVVSSILWHLERQLLIGWKLEKKSGRNGYCSQNMDTLASFVDFIINVYCSQISQNPILGMDTVTKPLFDYLNIGLNHIIASGIIGFSLGGLLHLLVDIPNPMGIPILTPYNRFSLKLWKSGKFENFICFILLFVNLYYIGILNFDFSILKF